MAERALSAVDDDILVRDHRSSPLAYAPTVPGRRRGWLVRRILLTSDLLGLIAAFAISQSLIGGQPFASWQQVVLLLASLPGWIVGAELYGLYDKDEERADHATTDDFAGVFQMVTVGAFIFLAVVWL